MSQISKLFSMSTNFDVDFLFEGGLPPLAPSFELKKILKSPANIIHFFWLMSKNFSKLWISWNIFNCLVSVLYKFIRIYWSASNVTSRIKISSALSAFCLLTTKDVFGVRWVRCSMRKENPHVKIIDPS